MWRTFITGLAMVCFLAGPGLTRTSSQMHEDNAWGFKVKVPRGWQEIPLKVNERWIIGKYMSDKSYVSEESYNHKPEMKIVVFPESVKKQRSRVEVKEDGESLEISLKYRYKDYRDYLKGNFSERRLLLHQGRRKRNRRHQGEPVRDQGRKAHVHRQETHHRLGLSSSGRRRRRGLRCAREPVQEAQGPGLQHAQVVPAGRTHSSASRKRRQERSQKAHRQEESPSGRT